MATVRVSGGLERELRKLAKLVGTPATARVGFLEGATYPDGTPTALVAAIHNYGAPAAGIPPRPFFTNMISQHQHEWAPAIAGLLRGGMSAHDALEVAGAAIAGQLRQSIIDTNDPPLAPSTVARKGFSKPLIETSHMIKSVDHEVVER